jgi:hypothetical protein
MLWNTRFELDVVVVKGVSAVDGSACQTPADATDGKANIAALTAATED